jgi:hypothetical protein
VSSKPSAISEDRMRAFWSEMDERYGKLKATGRPLQPMAIRLPDGSERLYGGSGNPVCAVELKTEAAFRAFSSYG